MAKLATVTFFRLPMYEFRKIYRAKRRKVTVANFAVRGLISVIPSQ